jgi:hypothetical protein
VGSSLSKRRMEDINPSRTIKTSISGWYQISIHSYSFLTLSTISPGRNGIPSLMYSRAITTSKSKKVMNRKLPSKPAKDSLSQL